MNARTIIAGSSHPRLAAHVRFRMDEVRGQWVVLAPERVLMPDAIATEVLKLCDGQRSVDAIAAELAELYQAPVAQVGGDVAEMLQDLIDKGVLEA